MKTLILAALALLSYCAPVTAQSCAPTQTFVDELRVIYGETVVFTGETLSYSGDVIMTTVWVNPATGTWSILRSAGGVSCMSAAGDLGQLIPEPPPEGDPS